MLSSHVEARFVSSICSLSSLSEQLNTDGEIRLLSMFRMHVEWCGMHIRSDRYSE